jgi:hypothetical protein
MSIFSTSAKFSRIAGRAGANVAPAKIEMELAANRVILTALLFGSRVLDIKISFSKDNLLDS